METMNMADNQSREEIRRNNHGELIIKVRADVDVSEALTGLKALQREAKEAVRALKELEEIQGGYRPVVVAPLTVETPFKPPYTITSASIPEHVKEYNKGSKSWTTNKQGPDVWFDDSE
jgi:hypothetical protein